MKYELDQVLYVTTRHENPAKSEPIQMRKLKVSNIFEKKASGTFLKDRTFYEAKDEEGNLFILIVTHNPYSDFGFVWREDNSPEVWEEVTSVIGYVSSFIRMYSRLEQQSQVEDYPAARLKNQILEVFKETFPGKMLMSEKQGNKEVWFVTRLQ